MKKLIITLVFLMFIWGIGMAQAVPPIPSTWEGEVEGAIHGVQFRLPIVIEVKKTLPHEQNPFHLFLGTRTTEQVGDISLVSAAQVGTGAATNNYKYDTGSAMGVYSERIILHSNQQPSSDAALLQYMTISQNGDLVTAVLSNINIKTAAAANLFTGPNISAMEASPVMRSVMEGLGSTEVFILQKGARLQMQFDKDFVNGIMEGSGRSVLNTSSDVVYTCRFQARRVE